MKIDLIPVILLMFEENEYADKMNLYPYQSPKQVCEEISFYATTSLTVDDWEILIRRHIGDLVTIEESCALFGGYALKQENEFLLFPQCCGTLAAIRSWQLILEKSNHLSGEGLWLGDDHPSPVVTLRENKLNFLCQPNGDDIFWPETKLEFQLDHSLTCGAIKKVIEEMEDLALLFDEKLANRFNTNSLRHLVWG
jgi:hypothetical protein